jgi:hypothetical protein
MPLRRAKLEKFVTAIAALHTKYKSLLLLLLLLLAIIVLPSSEQREM